MASRQAKPSRASDVLLALDRVAALAMTQFHAHVIRPVWIRP
jgi:hypothetical protein